MFGQSLLSAFDAAPPLVPADNFNTVLYNGNGGTQSITSVGFAPDFTWIKSTTLAVDHAAFDTVRGATKYLSPSTTGAEGTYSTVLNAFGSNGFTVGSNAGVNFSGQTYVSWNWKAGGTAVSNTDGTITSQVSANVYAGFSVITYNGATNATADTSNNGGAYWSVAHGLGAAPDLVFVKKRNGAGGWYVGGAALGSTGANGNHLVLNDSAAQVGEANILWGGSQTFNATTFGLGGWDVVNRNGDSYVAYCFKSISDYSKVGSFVGTGTSGNFVYVGFQPRFVLVKPIYADSWRIVGFNGTYELRPNSSGAESNNNVLTINPTGFTLNTADANSGNVMYLAIA